MFKKVNKYPPTTPTIRPVWVPEKPKKEKSSGVASDEIKKYDQDLYGGRSRPD